MVECDETDRLTPGDSIELMNENLRVVGLPGERLREAAGVLARSYHTNPNFVDFFPDEGARSRALPRMFAAGLRDALGFGHVYAATRAVESATRGELAGVAVWLPAGAFPLSTVRQLRALPAMADVPAASPCLARRLLRYTAGIARLHPSQPYPRGSGGTQRGETR